jgi:CheY-like chemotaxis protein/HPt (histidine-containing phosphotransfer) domain-containing protein
LRRFLHYWQCDFAEAPDVQAAVAWPSEGPKAKPFDAAIIDVDGLEVERVRTAVQLLRSEFGGLPVIGVMPLGRATGLEDSCGHDIAAWVTKPVKQKDFGTCLASVLGHGLKSPSAIEDGKQLNRSTRPARQAGRILVVEDNETNQEVAVGMLRELGYVAVDVVSNGQQALDALERNAFDLVLMDCQLPEMDGYQATRRIRQPNSPVRNPRIPVIAMTAHALAGDRARCLEAGMNDYIAKPILYPELQRLLDRWLSAVVPTAPSEGASLAESGRQACPVFDADDFLGRLMGNTDLAHRVVNRFLATTPQQLAALAEAVGRSDTHGASLAAHAIKGAAASVGGARLSEAARSMELSGKTGDLEAVRILAPELEKRFDEFRVEAGRAWSGAETAS